VRSRDIRGSRRGCDGVIDFAAERLERLRDDMYLQEPNAIGLSFRFDNTTANAAPVRWYQIIGVVRQFAAFQINIARDAEPTIYHPAGVGEMSAVLPSVRFAGAAPTTFVRRVRDTAAEVDPTLQLTGVGVLADRYDTLRAPFRSMAWAAP
jgi:hypothetical protein